MGGGWVLVVKVFLGETIITMSNGSSHWLLPYPSRVISRTFFQQARVLERTASGR